MNKTRKLALAVVMSLGLAFAVGATTGAGDMITADPYYGDID